jgi:hypothetical protein
VAQDALSGCDLALEPNPETIYTWQNGNNESKRTSKKKEKKKGRLGWGFNFLQVVSASRKERLSQLKRRQPEKRQ